MSKLKQFNATCLCCQGRGCGTKCLNFMHAVSCSKRCYLKSLSDPANNNNLILFPCSFSEEKNMVEQQEVQTENFPKKNFKVNPDIVALLNTSDESPHEDVVYQCSNCDKSITGLSSLKQHSIYCVGWKPKLGIKHKCCSFFLYSPKNQQFHSSDGVKCALCKKFFPSLIHLKAHMPKHGTNQCAVLKCGKKFATFSRQEVHLKKHISSMVVFTCPVCENRFVNENMLVAHCLLHIFKTYHCPECGDVFPSFHLVSDHMKKHNLFHCMFCQAKFENFLDWVYHHKANGSISCFHCQKRFISSFRFKTHFMHCKGRNTSNLEHSSAVMQMQFKCQDLDNPLKCCQEQMKPLIENRSKFFFYCKPQTIENCQEPSSSNMLKSSIPRREYVQDASIQGCFSGPSSSNQHSAMNAEPATAFGSASAG